MGHELFICEDAAFVTLVCPRLVFGNAVLAHLVKYLSPRKWAGTAFVLGKYQISVV